MHDPLRGWILRRINDYNEEAMKDTRPFNREHAQAGAPYACRDGDPATVLKWDARNPTFPLVGICGKQDAPDSWTLDGRISTDSAPRDHDLVMLPLGEIEGKPVFVGDELETNGFGDGWKRVTVRPGDHGFTTCRWPNAKQYPTTLMTDPDLLQAYAPMARDGGALAARNLANAALRHAIDAGQVVTMDDADKSLSETMALYKETKDKCRAVRDMAIAEAVRDACYEAAESPFHRSVPMDARTAIDAIRKVHLTTIIESVKP